MHNSYQAFLSAQVSGHKAPSVQYIFFDAEATMETYRSGLRNVTSAAPVQATTTYHLYSVTKTFTALAVLQLAQEGRVTLDKPAAAYISGFPYTGNITVRQLLNHSGGIPNPFPLRWIHPASEHAPFDRDAFFDRIFKSNPVLKSLPGTRFRYSNLGYVLLGRLIEQVSGQRYESYVEEHLIRRAGIDPCDLGFRIDPFVHATGYHQRWSLSNILLGLLIDKDRFMGPADGRWQPFKDFYVNGTAYGGMIGSAKGLVQYAQALLQKDSPLINDHYKNGLFTESMIGGKPTGMSLSWYTGSLTGHPYYAHAGGGGGYYVELRIYPHRGLGSVILFNRSGMKDERILDQADRYFLKDSMGAAKERL